MPVIRRWAGLVARLVVAVVWLVAGLLKVGDPAESVRAVRAYDLLPEGLVPVVGHALPILEIVVGLSLLVGLVTRWAAVVSGVMLIAFVVGISSAWARGLSIECGCFGGGGGPAANAADKYPWEIVRDIGLLLLSAYLIWRPVTPLSVDRAVLPAVAPSPAAMRGQRSRSSQEAARIRREAALKEQRRRNLFVAFGVAVALLAVVVVGTTVQAGRDSTGSDAAIPAGVVDRYAVPYGAAEAKVVVDVYEDFMCPFCGQFEADSRPLVQKYADAGVQFRYHVLAFLDRASSTRYSTRATNALGVVLDTAGPEVAKKFHDALYEEQPAENSPGLDDDRLIQVAVQAGADEAQVEQPIRKLAFRQWVANATDAASKAGVNQTPTVLVDGQPVGGQTIAELVSAMQDKIDAGLGG